MLRRGGFETETKVLPRQGNRTLFLPRHQRRLIQSLLRDLLNHGPWSSMLSHAGLKGRLACSRLSSQALNWLAPLIKQLRSFLHRSRYSNRTKCCCCYSTILATCHSRLDSVEQLAGLPRIRGNASSLQATTEDGKALLSLSLQLFPNFSRLSQDLRICRQRLILSHGDISHHLRSHGLRCPGTPGLQQPQVFPERPPPE